MPRSEYQEIEFLRNGANIVVDNVSGSQLISFVHGLEANYIWYEMIETYLK